MTVTQICVLGAGPVGLDIAATLAPSGLEVTLVDTTPGPLRTLHEAIIPRRRAGIGRSELPGVTERGIRSGDVLRDAVAAADVVIVAEDADNELTRALFEIVDRAAGPRTIIVSTSPRLSPTVMGSWTRRPDRVLSMHLVAPQQRALLVEIIRGMDTSRRTISRIEALAGMLGAAVALVDDQPGFVTGRIEAALANEAFHLLGEGVASASDIDRVARIRLEHPLGPLERSDAVGLDVRLAGLRHLHETIGERFRPARLLEQYVNAGRLGRSSGRGVFDYGPV